MVIHGLVWASAFNLLSVKPHSHYDFQFSAADIIVSAIMIDKYKDKSEVEDIANHIRDVRRG